MPRPTTLIAPLLVVLIAVGLHLLFSNYIDAYAGRVAMDAGIAVVLAVSLNIVNGYTGQFSIGHAAFFAIGAYAAGAVTYYASLLIWDSPAAMGIWSWQSLIFVAATIAGGLLAAAAGWLIGLPSLRLRGDYLAIVTLGFGEIMRVLLQQTNTQLYSKAEMQAAEIGQWFPPPVGGALGFINVPKVTNLFWVGLFTGLTLLVAWRLKKSTFGRAMIAVRENEIAAESMGVNVTRLKVWAFVFAAFFAGVAGSLYAHEVQITPQDAGFLRSFDVVIMVVLGGLGSITGATLAAVLVTVAGEWLREPTHVWHVAGVIAAIRIAWWPDDQGRIWGRAAAAAIVSLIALAYTGILAALVGTFMTAVPIPRWLATPPYAWCIFGAAAVIFLLVGPPGRWRIAAWWLALIAGIEAARALAIRTGVELGEYRMVIFALVLILTMILRPTGLMGTHEITDVFRLRRAARTHEEVAT